MGKKIKKGKVGPSKEFISRSKAIKKMQVSLKDFRRLCILKGIYPREPPKSLRKLNKTYYHVKDISYLSVIKFKIISFYKA
jgi:pescadillo protein